MTRIPTNSKKEKILHIDKSLVINHGRLRVCYQHPTDPDLVVKIPSENNREGQQANIMELKGYTALMREHTDLSFISCCHGFESTNLGKGLLCDCIRDTDGSVSKTIWDYIIFQEECDVLYIQNVVRKFCNVLIEKNVKLFDLNLKNIALRLLDDASYQPFAIDLKGRCDNHELIPISSYINYFSRKKLQRRSKGLIDRIHQFRQRRAEFKHVDI